MEECGVLEIFGEIDDAEALRRVARSAEWNGLGTDWEARSGAAEILEAIIEASEEGTWLRLMKDECDNFEETRMACRSAGLSYIHSRGVSGGEGYDTAAYWTPGREQEFVVGLVNGMDVAVPLREMQDAARSGQDQVRRLLDNLEHMTLEHVDKKLAISTGCRAELASAGLTS